MIRLRRLVSMVTASLAVLALGFVVAVAARSLPGEGGDEPLLDVDLTADIDLSGIVAWVLLLLAVLGAVLLALGIREARPEADRKRRNVLGILIALILFVALVRWLRPAAESLLAETAAAADSATEALSDRRVGSAGGWLLSILLAAVLAASLTRIGLSIGSVPPPLQAEAVETTSPGSVFPAPGPPAPQLLGNDPRSRVLHSYHEFESGLAEAGLPRGRAETTFRHARRAGEVLNLNRDEIRQLVKHHSLARYGSQEPSEADAVAAERSSSALRAWMRK